ncbi:large neutral amino acids transporter small subunit 4-like [Anneissia japonica]|uniref:large neutral amino acids transporter small subunit 4-like n=1 Tax=Anneissia japonica TaxID=1529436 RepID=UPI001425A495|nr:large neutral amino acids transporter small subunit 4-like [Anneissia japonica]
MSDGGLVRSKSDMETRKVEKRNPIIIIPAILEGFFTTLVYGWPWLVTVLKQEGYYSQLCDSHPTSNTTATISDSLHLARSSGISGARSNLYTSCSAQDQKLNLVFTLASSVTLVGCLPTGAMYDLLGPRKIRLIACVMFATTFLMYGFSSQETPFWIFPATAIQGFIGAPVLVSLFEVANLFPNLRHTIISLLNGACMMSTVVYLIVQKLSEAGIAFQHQMFVILGVYTILSLGNTFFIVPAEKVEMMMEEDDSKTTKQSVLYPIAAVSPRIGYRLHEHYLSSESVIGGLDDYKKLSRSDYNQNAESFWKYLKTPMCLLTVLWSTVLVFREYYFLGTLNPFLGYLANRNEATVNHYTTLFGYISFGIVLVSPLVGVVLDGGKETPLQRSILALMITTVSSVLYSITVLIPNLNVQLITFVLVTINRGFVHAVISSFIAIVFPKQHFGKFYGLVYLSSGISTFLQTPLLRLSQSSPDGNPQLVHIILLVVTLLGHFLPLYVWIYCKRELEKKRKEKSNTTTNMMYIKLQPDSNYSIVKQTDI